MQEKIIAILKEYRTSIEEGIFGNIYCVKKAQSYKSVAKEIESLFKNEKKLPTTNQKGGAKCKNIRQK